MQVSLRVEAESPILAAFASDPVSAIYEWMELKGDLQGK